MSFRLNAKFELQGSACESRGIKPRACWEWPTIGPSWDMAPTASTRCGSGRPRLRNSFDFAEFSHGDFAGAVIENVAAESVTRVLYPDDSTEAGRGLTVPAAIFHGELLAAGHHRPLSQARQADWSTLPERVAVQMNDTHPALSVAELMRILLDQRICSWDQAWDITPRTLAYTNHTLLPEALEKWPVELFEALIPRQLEIIYEINRRFLDDVRRRYPGDEARVQRVSLIEEEPARSVRMAHLAVVGSHSTNGVAAIHSELLRTQVLRDFAEMFPERFNNKTNGVTPRRWLQQANPPCPSSSPRRSATNGSPTWPSSANSCRWRRTAASASSSALPSARPRWRLPTGSRPPRARSLDPDTIFDSQIKRIHEYKRQLLNVLHIIVLYNRLRSNPNLGVPPHTFFFAGKAAPAYQLCQAHHQAHQQRCRHDQRRPGDARPPQGAVPARVQRQPGRAAHSRPATCPSRSPPPAMKRAAPAI